MNNKLEPPYDWTTWSCIRCLQPEWGYCVIKFSSKEDMVQHWASCHPGQKVTKEDIRYLLDTEIAQLKDIGALIMTMR